jgi:hypothetical protein
MEKIPNKETQQAIEDAMNGKCESMGDIDEFFDSVMED